MGRLIEKLERMQKTNAPRMGFASMAVQKQASVLLIGVVPTANRSLATAAANAGADCILVQEADVAAGGSLREKLGIADNVLCGGTISNAEADLDGLDFAVVDLAAPVGQFLNGERVDPVLSIQADLPDSTLRTIESLPIEAVILPGPAVPLTLQGLVAYYRVTKVTSKPVLSFVPAKAEPSLLRALQDAGIAGVLVEISSAAGAKALGDMRKAIDHLPARKNRANRTRMAVALGLPLAAAAAGPAPSGPPDEGDDGDGGDDE